MIFLRAMPCRLWSVDRLFSMSTDGRGHTTLEGALVAAGASRVLIW
jgi:hypothetical protein